MGTDTCRELGTHVAHLKYQETICVVSAATNLGAYRFNPYFLVAYVAWYELADFANGSSYFFS